MAKQRITPGAEIDVVTMSEIAALVKALSEDRADRYQLLDGAVAPFDGTGAGIGRTVRISSQYDFMADRVVIGGGAANAANALVTMFRNDENSMSNLSDVIQLGAAGLYADSHKVYIPANTRLVVVVAGGPPGGQITYSLLGRRLSPGVAR